MSLLPKSMSLLCLLSFVLTVPGTAEPPDYWLLGRDWSQEADPTFQIHHKSGAAPWISAHKEGSVVYLLFGFPPLILRYDMEDEVWLTDIVFAQTPTAMAIDDEGLYVAFGEEVKRFALDGTGESVLRTAAFAVDEMVVDGPYLFLVSGRELESVDKDTGSLIDSESYTYSMGGLSIARSADKIYARSVGVSPADIVSVDFAADGSLGTQTDSPFHGAYPSSEKTWVFPDEGRVADNSGIVYTAGLGYGGSLAGAFDDLTFHGSGPIVVRDDELFAHGFDLLETGRFELDESVSSIFVHGDSIYGFYSSTDGADVVEVPVGSLVPPVPGPPVQPEGLIYAPDQILMGVDGVIFLLSGAHLSVFRWSTVEGEYLETISLTEAPLFMTYSGINQRLYLAYLSGRITQIDVALGRGSASEVPFVNSPQQPCGLSAADPWIFVCDPSGSWVSHITYSPGGAFVSQVDFNYVAEEYVWSEANAKMYFIRSNVAPRDLIWEEVDPLTGVIGADHDSPLHSSTGMTDPVRVHPDGLIVLLGSGRYHDAITLELLEELGTDLVDGQWSGENLVTLHAAGDDSELRTWNSFLAEVISTELIVGAPLRLLELAGSQWAVTDVDGVPTIQQAGGMIFADGFEDGDTAAWSSTVP